MLQEELREACTEGDLAAVRALIHAGADVTAKHPSTGVEPLSYAAFHGRWEVAKLLMLHGASPEHAVEEAQRGGFLPLAEYLRIRRARYQREAQAAAIEAKRQKEGEVLARKKTPPIISNKTSTRDGPKRNVSKPTTSITSAGR